MSDKIEEIQEGQAKEQRLFEEAVYRTFSTEYGKQVLDQLIENHLFNSTINLETNSMAFENGQRSVVLYLKKIVDTVNHGKKEPEWYEG